MTSAALRFSPRARPWCALACLATVLSGAACSKATTVTSPSTTTSSTSTATVTETMVSTLPVGGSKFYSFAISTAGSVTATLQDIHGTNVAASTVVNLGIGTPSGATCSATQSNVQVTGSAGINNYVTISEQPGQYCVIVTDLGNLFAPAAFTITIDHP